MKIVDRLHFIGGLAPDSDFADGTKYTDVFEVAGEGALFLVWYGANASLGASTLTIEACDDTSPSNTTAVAFQYKVSTTFDTFGSWTQATTSGLTVGGSADSAWMVYVPAAELASEGYGYVRAKMVESTNQAADGVIAAFVVNLRDMASAYSVID